MKILLLSFLLIFFLGLFHGHDCQQPGECWIGGPDCRPGFCCSRWGWCGVSDAHCGADCVKQCPPPAPPLPPSPPPSPIPPPVGPLTDIIPKDLFETMLPYRNDPRCPANGFYTYEAFIAAANTFPDFGNVGNETTRKREIAAFFGQTSHETTGGWPTAPGGQFAWGYCFKSEIGSPSGYCDPTLFPCVQGKSYYGRGPMQLSWNYNYAQAGEALGLDLLSFPELVETDPVISFQTAIWFWMTPQAPKPSCHDVIIGKWIPSANDLNRGRVPGYGLTTNIINGGLECGFGGPDNRVESRIGYFKRYCDIYGIGYGDNLDCYSQAPFNWGLALSSM